MSDRAANEKLATKLLAEWRDGIIREFRGNDVTDMVHSFHCMAHVLLGFHQYSSKDIKIFEKGLTQDHGPLGRDKLPMFKFWRSTEAVVERVVRTTSDTFGPVGDHLCLRDSLEAHCKSTGTKSTIGNYKDNRFNALFQTAAEVFVHKKYFLQVLHSVEKPNKKLQSVKADLECPLVGILLQSFGLVYLKLTGPYWNMVTSGEIPYLKLYPYIQDLSTYLKKCSEDPAHILIVDGQWMTLDTFGFTNVSHKEMLKELYTVPEDHRDVLFTAIKIICNAMSNTVNKQLRDFLEGGKLSTN
ncbi:hypothetical protein FSP39_006401 [Pinctada imbricata]|uniref:Uncharacterized protein n=1 Tax=Pinctada imbricata TaxID=66713 RepID=A0AA88YQI4_PINIB|nr:hypothetical protein FSP39_006401 [Pinctada imbricata]